jgi:Domain of unknown function (DUF4157)
MSKGGFEFEISSAPLKLNQRSDEGAPKTVAEVGRTDDVKEREADRLADQALHRPVSQEIRRPSGSSGSALRPSLGEGKPLDPADRSYFEPRFGLALDDVRVHADERAADSAAAIHASAYTLGRDLVFGEKRYRPGTTEGRRLIAHELAHVAQQRTASQPVIRRQPNPPEKAEPEPTPPARKEDDPVGIPDAGPPETKAPDTGVTKKDNTPVYDTTLRTQKVVKTIKDKGTSVEITHDAGPWYRVLIDDEKGYISKSKLTVASKEKEKETDKEKKKETEQKPPPDLYQGIIDKALITLPIKGGGTFYHLPADFGLKMVMKGCNLAKKLPSGMGDKTGWLRQNVAPVFYDERVGAKVGGPQVYAMVTNANGDHFIARTAVHEHTVLPGGVVKPGHFPDALEAFWIFDDWEKRMAEGKK